MIFDNHRDRVEFFFGSTPRGTIYSSLALLRKDIDSLGEEVNPYFFPRSICLMVVIDLLAKMKFGDKQRNSGKRFKDFVKEFIGTEVDQNKAADALWAFRNGLHHSFNMSSPEHKGTQFSYSFILINNCESRELFIIKGKNIYMNFPSLIFNIKSMVYKYKYEVLNSNSEKEKICFKQMLETYGIINIG